jgi:hypothetical protein
LSCPRPALISHGRAWDPSLGVVFWPITVETPKSKTVVTKRFVLLMATELANAVKRRGVHGAADLMREAILRAGLDVDFALRKPR